MNTGMKAVKTVDEGFKPVLCDGVPENLSDTISVMVRYHFDKYTIILQMPQMKDK